MEVKSKERAYASPLRDQQARETRQRILVTARRLFVERGYVSTTIAGIAREAAVSPQTVYNSVGGKAAVLLALNDTVDEAGGVHAIQTQIAESTDPHAILALTARLRRQIMEEAGDIVALLAATAPVDSEVERAYRDGLERSRNGTKRIVERLDALGALRQDVALETLAATTYALLHHDLWTRLVIECGWTPDAFESWCAELLQRMLLESEES